VGLGLKMLLLLLAFSFTLFYFSTLLLKLFKMKNHLIFLLLLGAYPLHAQWTFKADPAGNPVITQEYVDEVIMNTVWEGLDGNTYSMADFEGKIVVIDFWQTWCGPCLTAFRGINQAKQKHPDALAIVAASQYWNDTEARIQQFIRSNAYPFHYVWAPEMGEEIGIKAIPFKIIIGPDGQLIESRSGVRSADEEYHHLWTLVNRHFKKKKK
jgi:thiol-disulfide isomerase/thioredoxin